MAECNISKSTPGGALLRVAFQAVPNLQQPSAAGARACNPKKAPPRTPSLESFTYKLFVKAFSRMAQVGGKGGPSGLAHISELSDGFVGDIHAEFQAGQGALSSTQNVGQIGGSRQIGRSV